MSGRMTYCIVWARQQLLLQKSTRLVNRVQALGASHSNPAQVDGVQYPWHERLFLSGSEFQVIQRLNTTGEVLWGLMAHVS